MPDDVDYVREQEMRNFRAARARRKPRKQRIAYTFGMLVPCHASRSGRHFIRFCVSSTSDLLSLRAECARPSVTKLRVATELHGTGALDLCCTLAARILTWFRKIDHSDELARFVSSPYIQPILEAARVERVQIGRRRTNERNREALERTRDAAIGGWVISRADQRHTIAARVLLGAQVLITKRDDVTQLIVNGHQVLASRNSLGTWSWSDDQVGSFVQGSCCWDLSGKKLTRHQRSQQHLRGAIKALHAYLKLTRTGTPFRALHDTIQMILRDAPGSARLAVFDTAPAPRLPKDLPSSADEAITSYYQDRTR